MRIDFEAMAEFQDQTVEFPCDGKTYTALKLEHMSAWEMNELRKSLEEEDRGQIQVIAYAVNVNAAHCGTEQVDEETVMKGLSKAKIKVVFDAIMSNMGES